VSEQIRHRPQSRLDRVCRHTLEMDSFHKASASTYKALTMPAKWLTQYDDFIIKNASAVSQIESALRSLTYIIPGMLHTVAHEFGDLYFAGRFRDAEIASESRSSQVYAQLTLLIHTSSQLCSASVFVPRLSSCQSHRTPTRRSKANSKSTQ
jgi:Peroxisomal membrane protein (Pex16)